LEDIVNREVENFLASWRYAPSTKDSYRRILRELIVIPDLDRLDAAGLLLFLDRPGWGNSQQNVAIFCAQKFLRWKYGEKHPALSATIPRIKPKPRRVLNKETALQVLASFNPFSAGGSRDLAIVAFGLDTGFRRAELCSMQLANVDFYSNTAQAVCKGGQWGCGAFSPQTAVIVQDWLRYRKPRDGVGNLFVSLKGGRALTGYGMACIFKRLSKALGFQISAHDLRSSYATLSAIFGASSRAGQIGGRWKTQEEYEHYTATLQLDIIRPHLPVKNLLKT
jgi:integrase